MHEVLKKVTHSRFGFSVSFFSFDFQESHMTAAFSLFGHDIRQERLQNVVKVRCKICCKKLCCKKILQTIHLLTTRKYADQIRNHTASPDNRDMFALAKERRLMTADVY